MFVPPLLRSLPPYNGRGENQVRGGGKRGESQGVRFETLFFHSFFLFLRWLPDRRGGGGGFQVLPRRRVGASSRGHSISRIKGSFFSCICFLNRICAILPKPSLKSSSGLVDSLDPSHTAWAGACDKIRRALMLVSQRFLRKGVGGMMGCFAVADAI